MASPVDSEDDVFESLIRENHPLVEQERERAIRERSQAQAEMAQQRLAELAGTNSTLPVTISSVRVVGASRTRRGFLDRIFNPLLSANQDRPYTLLEVLQLIDSSAGKLKLFDIYHDDFQTLMDVNNPSDPSTTPTDIDVYLSVREKSRLKLKIGSDFGNTEGSAYVNLLLKNVFGGAESFNLNSSAGTRTRSSYTATFETPILSNPNLRLSFDALANSTQKPWASHEEVSRGGGAHLRWATPGGHRHQFSYTGLWRQVTALAGNASPTLRNDAGDSVKSSITHTWISDRRNNPFLPSQGYFMKSISEIAGWGPLGGDVAFWKSEAETSGAIAIPVPGIRGDSGVTLTGGFRAGMIYPLPLGMGSESQPSRVNDRFLLGGPTDVRGFKIAGLGPRDGLDSVGGDVYAAASANLLFPFPRVGKDSPLRFQIFANGGRLLALKNSGEKGGMNSKAVQKSVYGTVAELANGLPSMAAGLGVVYAHPVARFELNFSLPLVIRKGEVARKGLQFGVGISFL